MALSSALKAESLPEADVSPSAHEKPNSTEQALATLNQALGALEKSVDRALEARNKAVNADEQIQRFAADRSKLARELDAAQARAKALADVNSDVSKRLIGAMETVRSVIEQRGR